MKKKTVQNLLFYFSVIHLINFLMYYVQTEVQEKENIYI